VAFLQTGLDVHATPQSFLSPATVALVHAAVLKACVGKDGGAPSDLFLNDPTQCTWHPRELLCRAGQDPAQCLNADQVEALQKIYDGFRDPRTSHIFYPGWPKGSEIQASGLFGTREQAVHGFVGTLVPWAFGPSYDVTRFDFDGDLAKVDAQLGPIMNHVNPDLAPFVARGGKLIIFHGLADGIFVGRRDMMFGKDIFHGIAVGDDIAVEAEFFPE